MGTCRRSYGDARDSCRSAPRVHRPALRSTIRAGPARPAVQARLPRRPPQRGGAVAQSGVCCDRDRCCRNGCSSGCCWRASYRSRGNSRCRPTAAFAPPTPRVQRGPAASPSAVSFAQSIPGQGRSIAAFACLMLGRHADVAPDRGHQGHHGDRNRGRRGAPAQRLLAGHQPRHEACRDHARPETVQPPPRPLHAEPRGARHLQPGQRRLRQGRRPAIRHPPPVAGRGLRAQGRLGAQHLQRHGAARHRGRAQALPQPADRHGRAEVRGGARLHPAGQGRGRRHELALRPSA